MLEAVIMHVCDLPSRSSWSRILAGEYCSLSLSMSRNLVLTSMSDLSALSWSRYKTKSRWCKSGVISFSFVAGSVLWVLEYPQRRVRGETDESVVERGDVKARWS